MLLFIILVCLLLLGLLIFYIVKKNNKENFVGGGVVSSLCNNKGYIYKDDQSSPELNDLSKNICYCVDGWSGDKCDFSACSGNGKLTEYKDASGNIFQKCVCNGDFKGDHCQYSDFITCNGKGTVSETGICTCEPNIFGRFCNSTCKNGKVVNGNCVCKKERMYFKDNINTNQLYKLVDIYKGNTCEEPIKLSDITDIENLYKDELPSDNSNENNYIFKICPFSKDIEIENLKVIIDDLLPYSIGSIRDDNGCYIIDPQKYNNYIPECISVAQGAANSMQYVGTRSLGHPPLSSGKEGKSSSPFCSPIKFSLFLGTDASITFDVINKKTGTKESGSINILQNGLLNDTPENPYNPEPQITVTGISNYYIRKGIADRFLSTGSMWQMPIGILSDFHLNHDQNARAYNIIIGDCVRKCDSTQCGGDDGCGGTCDIVCPDGQICYNKHCCIPNCSGKTCGDNGCGGSCGNCPQGQVCNNGTCCTPNCSGKVCGPDGCGGTCGTCPFEISCINNGTKCCSPVCSGDCGPDGCGGTCGTCSSGKICINGSCCTPNCTKLCGQDNGCGSKCSTTTLDQQNVKWILTGTSKPNIELGTYEKDMLTNYNDVYIFYKIVDQNTIQITTSQYSSIDPLPPIEVGDIFKFNISNNIYTHTKYPSVKLIPKLCSE